MGNELNDIVDYSEVNIYDLSDRSIYADSYIITNYNIDYYISKIIQDRWFEAEPVIISDPESAFYYTSSVIGGRWVEAEERIKSNHYYAYNYAWHVLKCRWVEAEPVIMMNPESACNYASSVIGGRWFEAEPYIMDNEHWWGRYRGCFKIDQR